MPKATNESGRPLTLCAFSEADHRDGRRAIERVTLAKGQSREVEDRFLANAGQLIQDGNLSVTGGKKASEGSKKPGPKKPGPKKPGPKKGAAKNGGNGKGAAESGGGGQEGSGGTAGPAAGSASGAE